MEFNPVAYGDPSGFAHQPGDFTIPGVNGAGIPLDPAYTHHEVPHGFPDGTGGLGIPNDGSYHELQTVFADGGDSFSVSALHFDPLEELLWMGNQGGHVTSYCGPHLQKYTSFQAHRSPSAVQQLLAFDGGILSLVPDGLRCNTRHGIKVFDYKGSDMDQMHSMIALDNRLLIGGQQDRMLELNLKSGDKIKSHDIDQGGAMLMKMGNNYLCSADTTGKIHLRDPSSLVIQHTLEPHSASVSDFDIYKNQLVSCGFSTRLGNYSLDRFLMVYDFRTLRALPPLHIPLEPLFVRYVPTFASRVIIMNQAGQFQLLDPGGLMTAENLMLYQIPLAGDMLMCMDVCSTYHGLSIGDIGGYIHLWADCEEFTFNGMSRETVFADPVDPLTPIAITNELASYGSIALPFPSEGEELASYWPERFSIPKYRPPPEIDPQILSNLKVVDFIGYAPKPNNQKRNQVIYPDVLVAFGNDMDDFVPESPIGRVDDPSQSMIPKSYRKVEIKYTGRLGVEDFNFRHYNTTNFAGLEPHIPNAYCNNMLQVLYFIEPLRCSAQSHRCEKEFCLACEIGLLFYMLDNCKGQTCQASNLLRAFRTIPEVSALGLLLGEAEESTGLANFPQLIQSWNRFFLQQIVQDTLPLTDNGEESADDTPIRRLFEADIDTTSRCRACNQKTTRESSSVLVTLTYPISGPDRKPQKQTFASLLQNSMCLEQSTYTFCEDCNKYQPSAQNRIYKRLPDVIAVNCHIETQSDINFWKKQYESEEEEEEGASINDGDPGGLKPCKFGKDCNRSDCKYWHGGGIQQTPVKQRKRSSADNPAWIPFNVHVKLTEDGKVEITESQTEASSLGGFENYSLHATICHIIDPKTGGNLIAHIHVGKTYHKRKEGVTHTQWYLFNDFSIESIDKHEAVDFNLDWKFPCILYFLKDDANEFYDLSIHNPLDISILQPGLSLSESNFFSPHISYMPLSTDEVLGKGCLVGIDAEFVALNKEEAEIRSDGTRSTIKPSQMALARVTCIRGQEPLMGQAFIDDYIATQEQVVDYLTRFSGIRPGDLDVSLSSKHLTTLKSTYLKLRFLVDVGVTFVGHGLRKDFRVINLWVPTTQVIDTCHLFNLARQRIVSLKFLAWFFLGIRIQTDVHDSVEDALTAVRLYRYYLEHSKNGEDKDGWDEELQKLYDEGRKLKWKVPEEGNPPMV